MVEKFNNNVDKKDLELILEVNRKAIEIESEVVDQNEEIISELSDLKKGQLDQDKKLDKLIDQLDKTNKDIFKIQILFVTGLLSLAVQIVQIFMKN